MQGDRQELFIESHNSYQRAIQYQQLEKGQFGAADPPGFFHAVQQMPLHSSRSRFGLKTGPSSCSSDIVAGLQESIGRCRMRTDGLSRLRLYKNGDLGCVLGQQASSGITGFFLNAVHASQGSQNENGKRGIKLTRATAEQLAASREEKRQVSIKSSHPVMSALLKEQKVISCAKKHSSRNHGMPSREDASARKAFVDKTSIPSRDLWVSWF